MAKHSAIWLRNTLGGWCIGIPPRMRIRNPVPVRRKSGARETIEIEKKLVEEREFDGQVYRLYPPRRDRRGRCFVAYRLLNTFGALHALSPHGYGL